MRSSETCVNFYSMDLTTRVKAQLPKISRAAVSVFSKVTPSKLVSLYLRSLMKVKKQTLVLIQMRDIL